MDSKAEKLLNGKNLVFLATIMANGSQFVQIVKLINQSVLF